MPKYPNQKHIHVIKQPCDRKNIYAMINIDALKYAAKVLKPGAFKLWTYLAKNQPHYELDLSSQTVLDEFSMKKDMYDNAVHELIDEGFLVLKSGKTNYFFYEKPLQKNLKMVKVIEYKKANTSCEKKENTTSNNTNTETVQESTVSRLNLAQRASSSLPEKQVSLDAGSSDEPPATSPSSPEKRLPRISPERVIELERKHNMNITKLPNGRVRFMSGKEYELTYDPPGAWWVIPTHHEEYHSPMEIDF